MHMNKTDPYFSLNIFYLHKNISTNYNWATGLAYIKPSRYEYSLYANILFVVQTTKQNKKTTH